MEIKVLTRQIQILFSALLMAQILFLGVVSFLNATEQTEYGGIMEKIPFITALILLPSGYWFFQKQIAQIEHMKEIYEKINKYRAASLVKWACFEGATLLAIVTFFLTANTQLQYVALSLIFHFAWHFPTQARVCRELQVSEF